MVILSMQSVYEVFSPFSDIILNLSQKRFLSKSCHSRTRGRRLKRAKRTCLSLPAGKQAVGRSGILLKTKKDSGQAGMTTKGL
jgi:hypothetical protein